MPDQIVRLWHAVGDGAPASRLFADEVMREASAAAGSADGRARLARATPASACSAHTLRRLRDFVGVEPRRSTSMSVRWQTSRG